MSIAELNATQAREKLGEKQKKLGEIFEQALVSGLSGKKQYDFNRVTCLGADVKGSVAVAEKVAQINAEADELAKHAETLEGADNAAKAYEAREAGRRYVPLPGGKGDDRRAEIKALSQRIAEEKGYKAWQQNGSVGGISFNFDDMWASDFLAKGADFETIGTKTLMSRSAGWAPEVTRAPGFSEAVTRPIQLLDILPMFPTNQSAYKYMQEITRTHAAAERAEGAAVPESTFVLEERTAPVEKIGDSIPVTDEQLSDVAGSGSYIDNRMGFGVRQRLDGQVLVGDGSTPNIRGLKNVAGINTQAMGVNPAMDAFFRAMTKVRVNGRAIPTHHLIHPLNWQDMRLQRTADGVYIFGSPTDAGPDRLWGLPVIQVEADDVGRGYTGSFLPTFCSLHELQGVVVEMGFVGDQFVQFKRTVRASVRAVMVWNRPAAFTEVTDLGDGDDD